MIWINKTEKILIAAGLIGLCGCRASGGAADSSYIAYDSKNAALTEEAYETEAAYGAGSYLEEPAEADYPQDGENTLSTEKLVYRGSLSIQSRDYEKSASLLREKIHSFGGIIENENEYSDGGYYYSEENRNLWTLSMSVRIPTERFEEFMSGNDDLGNVISRSSSAENISRRYNDVSAQIEALQKQQTRLLEMMDKAETIEDMIAVEDRLSEVQYELNSLMTSRNAMDTDVAYSTVNITLREVRVYTETSDSFLERLGSRFVNGFGGFAEKLGDLILTLAYLFPYLLIIGIILLVMKKTGKYPHIRLPKFFGKGSKTE